jgi:probable F420-dependent oxidoreductase
MTVERPAPRIGIDLPDGLDVSDRIELAIWAEEHGFDDVWASEISDPDVFVVLGAIATRTDRIRLGTAIVPIGSRSATSLAAAAASVARLSGGRFALGVGVSTEVIISRWHGVPYDRPLERARETLEVLRAVLNGQRTDHDGRQVHSRGFRLRWPPDEAPPLLLAAMNEKMLELAGAAADGVCLTFLPVDGVESTLAAIDRGVRSSGRATRPETSMGLICQVTDDVADARARFRAAAAAYMTAPPYQRALTRLGFEDEVENAKAAWRSSDLSAVAGTVSDRLVDALTAIGDPETCRARIAAYHDAGIDSISISNLVGDPRDTLRHVAPAR